MADQSNSCARSKHSADIGDNCASVLMKCVKPSMLGAAATCTYVCRACTGCGQYLDLIAMCRRRVIVVARTDHTIIVIHAVVRAWGNRGPDRGYFKCSRVHGRAVTLILASEHLYPVCMCASV